MSGRSARITEVRMKNLFKLAFILTVVAVLLAGSFALAGKPKPGGGGGSGCPKDILCADVWIPVQCADGNIYSNQCYADRACAPGPCVRVDGGPVEVEGS